MTVAFRVIERDADAPMPVTPAEAVGHLRLTGVLSEDDPDLLAKLAEATELAESATGRVLRPSTIEVTVIVPDGPDGAVLLPGGPVDAVTVADYLPTYGGVDPLDLTTLSLDHDGDLSRLRAVGGWPLGYGSRLRLRLHVGVGPVPDTLKSAIKMILGHLWMNREAVSDVRMLEVPMGARWFLSLNRVNWGA